MGYDINWQQAKELKQVGSYKEDKPGITFINYELAVNILDLQNNTEAQDALWNNPGSFGFHGIKKQTDLPGNRKGVLDIATRDLQQLEYKDLNNQSGKVNTNDVGYEGRMSAPEKNKEL